MDQRPRDLRQRRAEWQKCGWLATASGCSKQVLLHMHDVCWCGCVCRLRGVGVTSVTRQRNPHGGGVAMVSASQESAWSHITAAAYTCVWGVRVL